MLKKYITVNIIVEEDFAKDIDSLRKAFDNITDISQLKILYKNVNRIINKWVNRDFEWKILYNISCDLEKKLDARLAEKFDTYKDYSYKKSYYLKKSVF